ncbi:sensor histidine kinase [Actinoplanes sp. URMC 104]|uniref:sensor histidine kinase n=1 Tax=Actinoplanes sp. URMC 104 TaxID=3423409 RepID=UPI003F1BDA70
MRALHRRGLRLLTWLLPPALGALAVLEALSDPGFRPTPAHLVVVAAWIPAGLALARWRPAAGAAVVAGFYPVGIVLDIPGPGGTGLIATLLAVGWAGFAEPVRRSRLGLVVAMVVYAASDTVREGFSWMNVFFSLIFVVAWWSGVLVQRERQRSRTLVELAAALDAQREAVARAAVAGERTRIAREIHDAVAHSVSVMTLQIGGLRRQLHDVLETRETEREVMLGLERLGRQSVDELRALVGIMRDAGTTEPAAPAPSLSRAEELVADVRAAGLSVGLEVEGSPGELHRALDVSAYRVLQEALTNVLRHAPGSHADVTIRYAPDAVTIEVIDEGGGAVQPSGTDRVGGNGLIGMRERTAMFGGTLRAGPRDEGGFAVTARFPIARRWQ